MARKGESNAGRHRRIEALRGEIARLRRDGLSRAAIAARLDLTLHALDYHLAVLRRQGVLAPARVGRQLCSEASAERQAAMIARLRAGRSVADVARAHGVAWQTVDYVRRKARRLGLLGEGG